MLKVTTAETVKIEPKDDLRVRPLNNLLSADIPTRSTLLGSWLTDRHLNMTYAPTGVGKSMFAMTVALAVAGGGSAFGWQAREPHGVLYVDGEMDVIDLKERASLLLEALPEVDREAAGGNLKFLAFQDQEAHVVFPDLAFDADHTRVLEMVERFGSTLVILDNFSTLCTVEEENSASSFNPIMNLMRRLKQLGCAVMLIHHARKNNTASGGSYRGTSKMGVVFNTIIALDHATGVPSSQGTAFRATWEKFRGLQDETVTPFTARLNRGGDGAAKWEVDTSGSSVATLVELLKSCTYGSQQSLAEKMEVTKSAITKWKAKAIRDGLISNSEWDECLRLGRELAQEEDAEDLGLSRGPPRVPADLAATVL